MNRTEVLDKAKGCVCGDRDHDYGGPEKSFECIAQMWNAYLGAKPNSMKVTADSIQLNAYVPTITPADVAAMMAMLKLARIAKSPEKADSWIDLAGYAACGGECAVAEECTTDGIDAVCADLKLREALRKACDRFDYACTGCPFEGKQEGLCHTFLLDSLPKEQEQEGWEMLAALKAALVNKEEKEDDD